MSAPRGVSSATRVTLLCLLGPHLETRGLGLKALPLFLPGPQPQPGAESRLGTMGLFACDTPETPRVEDGRPAVDISVSPSIRFRTQSDPFATKSREEKPSTESQKNGGRSLRSPSLEKVLFIHHESSAEWSLQCYLKSHQKSVLQHLLAP